jgi:Domain of unknown function (DUF4129)
MPQGLARDPGLSRRVVAVAALCLVTTAGLLARQALPSAGTSWASRVSEDILYDVVGALDGAAAVASLVFLVVVIKIRRKQRREQAAADPSLAWWTRMVSVLVPLTVVGVPIALLIHELLTRRRHGVARTVLGGLLGGVKHARPVPSSGGWAVAVGMGIAVVALITIAALERRRRARLDRLSGLRISRDAALEAALSAGAAAMDAAASPRAGIIACYAAMEQSLADAGAAPEATDTPDEVLIRAACGGLVRSAAAGELTGLFRQARYGGREMAESDRAAAQNALARLTADLGGNVPAGAGT